MYTLYYSPFACSFAVHTALEKCAAPFKLEKVDIYKHEHLHPQYLALNPNAQVPLLTRDETTITQASAIMLYLAEQHPESQLMPSIQSQDRAKAIETLFYLSNTVHPYFLRLFYPKRISEKHPDEVKKIGLEYIHQEFEKFNQQLSNQKYCVSNTIYAPDYYWLAMLNWAIHHKIDLSAYKHLNSYISRMRKQPEVQTVFEKEMRHLAA